MNKRKLFAYEWRRIFFSKPFFLMAGLIVAVSILELKNSVLYGALDTAPFSEWTFLAYLTGLIPYICAAMLFFVSRLTAARTLSVEAIASATPMPARTRYCIKLAAVLLCYLLLAALLTAMYHAYTALTFGARGTRIGLAALLLLPPALLCLGVGAWLGRAHTNLVYVMVALLFFISFIRFTPPMPVDIIGKSILETADASMLANGVIPFSLPSGYLPSRLGMGVVGVALCAAYLARLDAWWMRRS